MNGEIKVLFSGYTHSWLGDRNTHCIIQAGPNTALSIISAVHRVDHEYGLPDVRLGNADDSAAALVAAIKAKDTAFEIASIVPVKLLKPDDHPDFPPHPGTGLRTLTGSCGALRDQFRHWRASDVPRLLEYVAGHEHEFRTDAAAERDLSWCKLRGDVERWGALVVLDPDSAGRCIADPHPVKTPVDFVVSWFSERKSLDPYVLGWPWGDDKKLTRVDVSCEPGSSKLVVKATLEAAT